jgi:hypothetical protein
VSPTNFLNVTHLFQGIFAGLLFIKFSLKQFIEQVRAWVARKNPSNHRTHWTANCPDRARTGR